MSETYYLIIFCSIIIYAVFYQRKSLAKPYGYFLLYLMFMFSLDLLGYIIYTIDRDNLHIYNILTLLEFNVLFLFYRALSEDKITKRVIKYSFILFNSIYVFASSYYIYHAIFSTKYISINATAGSILIAIVLFLFFRELLVSNKVLNYKKEVSFWITLGLLVYYLGSTPVASLLNFLNDKSIITIDDFTIIQFSLGAFMQSCFIFGILWSYKTVK